VVSLNIPLLVVICLLSGWVTYKSIQRYRRWRSEFNNQKRLLQEKEKEIIELQNLWKINPSAIEWKQLLSKFVQLQRKPLLLTGKNVTINSY